MDIFELLSKVDYKGFLILGGLSWLLISTVAIIINFRFFTAHWKREEEFKIHLQNNSETVKKEIHSINNFLMKWEGTLKILSRDSEEFKKDINRQAHAITAIMTTLHIKGIMKHDFTDAEPRISN